MKEMKRNFPKILFGFLYIHIMNECVAVWVKFMQIMNLRNKIKQAMQEHVALFREAPILNS